MNLLKPCFVVALMITFAACGGGSGTAPPNSPIVSEDDNVENEAEGSSGDELSSDENLDSDEDWLPGIEADDEQESGGDDEGTTPVAEALDSDSNWNAEINEQDYSDNADSIDYGSINPDELPADSDANWSPTNS